MKVSLQRFAVLMLYDTHAHVMANKWQVGKKGYRYQFCTEPSLIACLEVKKRAYKLVMGSSSALNLSNTSRLFLITVLYYVLMLMMLVGP